MNAMAIAAPDQALLAQAASGSTTAWNQLIARHHRRVLVALLGDGLRLEQANEIAQETWARLWAAQRAGKLGRLELPGLAITQARFLVKDAWRKERTKEAASELHLVAATVTPTTEDEVTGREQLARLEVALRGCSAQNQRIFRLAQEDGVPHADIAERVGLSLQRVRQIIWEVRTKLRTALEEG